MTVVDNNIIAFPRICASKGKDIGVDVAKLSLCWEPGLVDGIIRFLERFFSVHTMMTKWVGYIGNDINFGFLVVV